MLRHQKIKKHPLTLKWKIARDEGKDEEMLLLKILKCLPPNAKLRLDANAGLNWKQAQKWARHFIQNQD